MISWANSNSTLRQQHTRTQARYHSYYHGLQSDSAGPTMPCCKIRAFNGSGQFSATDESKIIAETMDSNIRQVRHCTQRRKHGAKSGEYQDVHLGCFRAEAYRFGRV
jgi:hypothetical protein